MTADPAENDVMSTQPEPVPYMARSHAYYEAQGFDKMRSSIEIQLKNGETVTGNADERYRGGPENPLTDEQLKDKVRSCCAGVLSEADTEKLINASLGITETDDATALADHLKVSL